MKLVSLLLLATLGLATALETTALSPEVSRPHRKTRRPARYTGSAAARAPRVPAGAPSGYRTSLGRATAHLSPKNLRRLPTDMTDPDATDVPPLAPPTSRRPRHPPLLRSGRAVTPQDFYECRSSNPAPTSSDCDTVISQVYASDETLVLSESTCLVFDYGTCRGFFCALCSSLATSTDFVGNQLSTVASLCVDNGQVGAIVGEDAPQFDAGFVYKGGDLPTYDDVC